MLAGRAKGLSAFAAFLVRVSIFNDKSQSIAAYRLLHMIYLGIY